jgi:hypothetical protein
MLVQSFQPQPRGQGRVIWQTMIASIVIKQPRQSKLHGGAIEKTLGLFERDNCVLLEQQGAGMIIALGLRLLKQSSSCTNMLLG